MRRAAAALFAALLAAGCGAPPGGSNGQAANGGAAAGPSTPPAEVAPAPPPPPPHSSAWSATGYALNGAAPVWGGSVSGTTVRYMTPEDQFGDVIETRLELSPDAETYSGSWKGAPFVLTIRRAACSDGLSDRTYPFAVQLRARGETRRGCADPQ